MARCARSAPGQGPAELSRGERRAVERTLRAIRSTLTFDREGVARELERSSFPALASKVRSCGELGLPLVCGGCRDPVRVVVPIRCDVAGCPTCSERRARRIIPEALRRFREVAEADARPSWRLMLLTLTFRNATTDQAALLVQEYHAGGYRSRGAAVRARIVRSWLKRTYPGARGSGGYWTFELGAGGNLHAHALVWGPYIPHARLKSSWSSWSRIWRCRACSWEHSQGKGGRGPRACERCRGTLELVTSEIVDVRAVYTPLRAVLYVLAYLSKPVVPNDPALSAWWAWGFRGLRRSDAWGAVYPVRAAPRREGFVCPRCARPFMLSELVVAVFGRRATLAELTRPPPGAEWAVHMTVRELRTVTASEPVATLAEPAPGAFGRPPVPEPAAADFRIEAETACQGALSV